MNRHLVTRALAALAGVALASTVSVAFGHDDGPARAGKSHSNDRLFKAELSGFEEVPVTMSHGQGSFAAIATNDDQAIAWTLSYDGLETDAFMAHIHVGQRDVNGGISVWLCGPGNASSPAPAGTQNCPARSGVITGSIFAQNVVGPTGQLVGAGEFADLLLAMRAGVAYVNVHTSAAPGGEIRGQLR